MGAAECRLTQQELIGLGVSAEAGSVASPIHDRPDDERDAPVAHGGPDAVGAFERDKPVKCRPDRASDRPHCRHSPRNGHHRRHDRNRPAPPRLSASAGAECVCGAGGGGGGFVLSVCPLGGRWPTVRR